MLICVSTDSQVGANTYMGAGGGSDSLPSPQDHPQSPYQLCLFQGMSLPGAVGWCKLVRLVQPLNMYNNNCHVSDEVGYCGIKMSSGSLLPYF